MNLILRSLQLDWKMVQLPMPLYRKVEFILKKYLLLVKNYMLGYSITKSYVTLFGEKYYYDDKFGIAFLQSVFVDHYDLVKHIRPGGVVIDVGANVGQFNFFSRHGLGATAVYSFEPIKETFDVLKLNAVTNIYNLGIASKDREQIFYMPETSLMASSCKVGDFCNEVKVVCSRLDEIEEVINLESIQLVKIDTEGSELDVVKASLPILKRAEYVLIEASVARESAGDLVELTCYLRDFLPELKMIWIGRHFDDDNGTTVAVDCLFRNFEVKHH